jgi:hypothetical protein
VIKYRSKSPGFSIAKKPAEEVESFILPDFAEPLVSEVNPYMVTPEEMRKVREKNSQLLKALSPIGSVVDLTAEMESPRQKKDIKGFTYRINQRDK